MKTKKWILVLAAIGLIFSQISCSETLTDLEQAPDDEAVIEKSGDIVQTSCGLCTYTGTLTDNEIDGLMHMREEEKLAHDVYVFLYNKWNYRVFLNISKSETAHTNAVLRLINGYNLTDPALAGEGEYTNPVFTGMYAQLTNLGTASLVDALTAGALIEETDIADLVEELETTQNADVKRVYTNLLAASKIHLRAFAYSLKRQGVVYAPTILSVEEYNEIVD